MPSLVENSELNDLRKIICLRKIEVCIERIAVSYVIDNLMELAKFSIVL